MPATTPTGYEAATLDLAIEMLAQSATFRTLVGAATPALARGFIVNGWGGDPVTANGKGKTTMADGGVITRPTKYAIVAAVPDTFRRTQIGLREWSHSGQIRIVVQDELQANESAESITVRGRNNMGAIATEIEAQFGTAGRLLGGDLLTSGPSLPDATGSKRGTYDFMITIDWRDS